MPRSLSCYLCKICEVANTAICRPEHSYPTHKNYVLTKTRHWPPPPMLMSHTSISNSIAISSHSLIDNICAMPYNSTEAYFGYASPLQQRCVRAPHAELSASQASRKKGRTVGTRITHVTLHTKYMSKSAQNVIACCVDLLICFRQADPICQQKLRRTCI